jgi:Regulator of Vps4 activity in the MVB pathway
VCPEELRESVAGLIFATSRCGDLQELQHVRRIFASKFGKDFVQAATELCNGCAVDPKVPSLCLFDPPIKRVILIREISQ